MTTHCCNLSACTQYGAWQTIHDNSNKQFPLFWAILINSLNVVVTFYCPACVITEGIPRSVRQEVSLEFSEKISQVFPYPNVTKFSQYFTTKEFDPHLCISCQTI